jgi:hypothetical protein
LRDDASQELLRLRAKREANAEFARARANRKRQHARDPYQCNRERDRRENSKDEGVQPLRRQDFCSDIFQSRSALDRLVG